MQYVRLRAPKKTLLKKKAFYIGSNGLSTSVMTRGGNPGSLNHNIGFMTVFEGRLFYIGCLATTDVEWVAFYSGSKAETMLNG